MQCPSSRDAMTCNGRSSDLLSKVGKHLPSSIFTSGISLPMRDNLQLRDSSGITPLSLFNHDGNEPIAYAKIRQRGEIGK